MYVFPYGTIMIHSAWNNNQLSTCNFYNYVTEMCKHSYNVNVNVYMCRFLSRGEIMNNSMKKMADFGLL